jgi:hypothetical protein
MHDFEGDLAVLVPDADMEAAVTGLLLSRPPALGIRDVGFDVFLHRDHDNGCFMRGHDFLRPMVSVYAHGLILFDRHGCGQEKRPREELERIVAEQLSVSGWGDRAAAVVIDPELESWIWSDSPHVDSCLGWEGKKPNLRKWLEEGGWWPSAAPKPERPKEAFLSAIHRAQRPPSSAIFEELAIKISLKRCTDAAFLRFREILQKWFPAEPTRAPSG